MAIDFSSIYGYSDSYSKLTISGINTSTARFKGTVTGYRPVEGKYGGTVNNAQTSEQTKEYLSGLKEHSNGLKAAAEKMMSRFPPLFEQMTAASNNTDALSVSYNNKKSAPVSNLEVGIQQLATTQQNTGSSLAATEKANTKQGYNSFAIDIGNKSHNFSVNIKAGDTNRSAQQKMADAINKRDVGVTARVAYDDVTKKSSLVIEGNETGEKNGFSLRDVGQGTLVASTGASNIGRQAQDSLYTVNGEEKTSASNTVSLGNGITGTLKKADSNATVSMEQDTKSIINAIYDLVNNYNDLLGTAKDNAQDSGAQSIIRQLTGAASTYQPALSRIGITANDGGYLTIDTDKLKASVENGSAETALGSPQNANYGFVSRVGQVASSVNANPSRYASRASYAQAGNNTGTSGGASGNGLGMSFWNEYRVSQMTGIGLLFDGLV